MGRRPKNPNDALRSIKIDFGCIVYKSTGSRELRSLETVSNEATRISSRCFKFTPISSPQVITEEPPLELRRDRLSLKHYYKVKSLPQNPAFIFIIQKQETLYANKYSPHQFAIKIQEIHTKLDLENNWCPAKCLIVSTRNQRT